MNYVTIYEEYKHKFFQLPKVFFTSEHYKDMSNNAKVAWSILRDRSSLSRKNKWFDKDTGRIYFIFKNKELMQLLNIKSETTLVNVKKELEKASLIEQDRIGYNRPNKIYLLYPVIEEDDIYKIDEFENYKPGNEKEPQSQEYQGTSENGVPKNEVPYPQKMKSSNTDLSDTDKDLDTLDTGDTKKADCKIMKDMQKTKEKEQRKKEYMDNAFYANKEKIPEHLSLMLKTFSESTEQAANYYRIILKAKQNAEEDYNVPVLLESEPELLQEIIHGFARSIRKIEKDRDVENVNGYIYKTVYDLISSELFARKTVAGHGNKSIYYNWLENDSNA